MMGERDRDRELEIATAWRAATVGIAYIPLPAAEVQKRFEQLAADALSALASNQPAGEITQQGRAIGRRLVSLNLRNWKALEQTLACLSDELNMAAPQRLSWLLAGIAGGFAEAAELDLLGQQETLRRAATAALRQAQADLRSSRDDLAKINRELSDQINERIRAEEAQRQFAERLQGLHKIDLAILSAESLPAIVDIAIGYLQQMIPAHVITISLIDSERSLLVVQKSTSSHYPAGRTWPVRVIDPLRRLEEWEVLISRDLSQLSEQAPGIAELVDLGARSLMALPFRYHGVTVGSLIITLAVDRDFTEREVNSAVEIADSVTIAIQNRRLLEAEREAHSRESTLREVAASLTMGLQPDKLLPRILAQLDKVIPGSSSAVFLVTDDVLSVAALRGISSTREQLTNVTALRPPLLMAAIEKGEPSIVNDTANSPDWIRVEDYEYIRAWMGVPLVVKGETIGVISIDRSEPNTFSERERDLAMIFANQAAIAIDNARLFSSQQEYARQLERRFRQRERELKVLYGITVTAVSNTDLESLLERTLELAIDAFDCTAAAVFLIEAEESELSLSVIIDHQPPIAGALLELVGNDPSLWPQPVNTLYMFTDSELPDGWPAGAGSALAVLPLRSSGFNLGLFCLACDSAERLAGETFSLLTTVVDQIAVAVENIRLRHIARQAAIIEERERLAQEVHDSVMQSIYSVGLFAGAAQRAVEAGDIDKAQDRIQSILNVTDLSLRELRLLLFEFRPEALGRLGLVEALRERLRVVERQVGIHAEVNASSYGELPFSIEEPFYRVALEALNNSLRHAQASQVEIALTEDDGHLLMVILDDGTGFDQSASTGTGGMGLESMQKRISKVDGVLTVKSQVGGGTVVLARAPLP